MIKIRIRDADNEIDIQFPISESALSTKLTGIRIAEDSTSPPFAVVSEVYWPKAFSMLTGRTVNLDELNYLAKRMESFDALEYDQFLVGISKLDSKEVRDLINLTFNLDRFTLCQDVSSFSRIGRQYVLNTQGAVPADDQDDPKYAAIGKELIDRGLAQITERGLLIYNPFDPLTEEYDGQTFPPYYYEDTPVSVEATFNGHTELLQFPAEELAIRKALARLGAPSDTSCEIAVEFNHAKNEAWEDRIRALIQNEGLCETNEMIRALDVKELDWEKLDAVIELTEVHKASNIAFLARHLDEFALIPHAEDEAGVAHYLVDNLNEYAMDIEMEDFFDFPGFGAFFAEEHAGRFVDGGFVYYKGISTLDEFLEELESEDEAMTMGGMQL